MKPPAIAALLWVLLLLPMTGPLAADDFDSRISNLEGQKQTLEGKLTKQELEIAGIKAMIKDAGKIPDKTDPGWGAFIQREAAKKLVKNYLLHKNPELGILPDDLLDLHLNQFNAKDATSYFQGKQKKGCFQQQINAVEGGISQLRKKQAFQAADG